MFSRRSALTRAGLLCALLGVSLGANILRVNPGGPFLGSIGFRSDLTAYLTNSQTSTVSIAPGSTSFKGSWAPVYESYRYSNAGDLEYSIPVPAGTFSVAMMFLESWVGAKKPNFRVFNLKINGKTVKTGVDVFKSVGFLNPLYTKFNNVQPAGGFITITVARIPGKQNPMISGFVIFGNNADGKIGNTGLGSSSTSPVGPPAVDPMSSNGGDPSCSTGIFGKNNANGAVACCPSKCGKCGGKGCASFAKGELCCISHVVNFGKSCDTNNPPCIPSSDPGDTTTIAPPTTSPPATSGFSCSSGILGVNAAKGQAACCPAECGKCGGKGCATFAPGKLCCISNVYASGASCSDSGPPCIPDGSVSGPDEEVDPGSPDLSCSTSGATGNSFRLNVGAGAVAGASMGADNEAYVSSAKKGLTFSLPSQKVQSQGQAQPWDAAFSSHRYSDASVLAYKIPVPSGSYTVKLLFAETYFTKAGQRTFDVYINGIVRVKDLDVFKTVGKNVGLTLSYSGISPQAGNVLVTLIKSVENAMISGILIEGAGAGQQAVGGGCVSASDKVDSVELNGGFNHRSHSVPGGPYIATDFDNNGFASVSFDGTQSHSHYNDPGPPEVTGTIVSYKWSWTEVVNGVTTPKSNNNKSGKFTDSFPLGKTIVTLEVVDSTGDVASDSAVVEVKGSAEKGVYCYYYDYGDSFFAAVPLPLGLDTEPKPLYGASTAAINFNTLGDFGSFPFSENAFAVRCTFFVDIPQNGDYSYSVEHQGPFKLYHSNALLSQSKSMGTTTSTKKSMVAGLNTFQLLYFRPKNLTPKLVFKQGAQVVPDLQHDSSATLPVIIGTSKSSSAASGGQNIQIYGSGFINGVSVKFGTVEATNLLESDPGTLQVTVPPGSGVVPITVSTNAGTSNEWAFSYTSGDTLSQPVIFKEQKILDTNGAPYSLSFITSAVYGPDGRLYLGGVSSKVYSLGIDKEYKVTSKCEKSIGSQRAVLGVAFSPFSNDLNMYFTTNTLYWKDKNLLSFEKGWPNGNIETIQFSPTQLSGGSCAFGQKQLVTGLPVSNHDHGVNKIQFLPNGEMLVSIGGFTNGGISVPGKKPVPGDAKDDLLGGVASNPLSAAIVSCPANTVTNVVYDNYADPENAKIIGGGACKVYASGLRNSFGMTLHTNGNLYAIDNGPNAKFGEFSTDCNGGQSVSKNIPDKLFLVQKGQFHGHANLNRNECANYPPSAVQPLVGNLQSSSNGIVEYRSNTFGGDIKGNLYLSKFAVQNSGQVAEVQLAPTGGLKNNGFAAKFLSFSGLSLVEGPRGELVMPRVYQKSIVVAVPSYPAPTVTFLLGVHPKQGPSFGGTTVLISGHNFGTQPKATFGGSPCTNVVVIDDESFTCKTPAKGKNQLVSVVVTGSLGESPSYGSDFWYL